MPDPAESIDSLRERLKEAYRVRESHTSITFVLSVMRYTQGLNLKTAGNTHCYTKTKTAPISLLGLGVWNISSQKTSSS